jgi:hypothetical protein
MEGSNEDRGRSRRLGAKDQAWSSTGQILGGQTIERSGDTVCGLYHAQGDEEHGFFWFSIKTKVDVFSQFGFKTSGYGSCGLASKHSREFLGLSLKTDSYGLMI